MPQMEPTKHYLTSIEMNAWQHEVHLKNELQNLSINFDSNDHYVYGGQRLIDTQDGYYHKERETYERIQVYNLNSTTSYWKVTEKNGTKLYFGYNSSDHMTANDGHVDAVGKTGKALVWALSKVEDIHGNYLTIEYDEDSTNGTFYPELVTYTRGNGLIQGFKTVEFTWETRTDHFKTYSPTAVEMTKRLQYITVKLGGNLLKKFHLEYEYGTTSNQSRLIKLTQYGSDGITSLPPQEFIWDEGDNGFEDAQLWLANNTFNTGNDYLPIRGDGSGSVYSTIQDMNGDGLADRIEHHNNSDYGIWVALNNGTEFDYTNASKWLSNSSFNSGYEYLSVRSGGGGTKYSTLRDMNGDGLPDRVGHYNNGNYGIWVALNTGTKFDFANATKWLDNNTFNSGYDYLPEWGGGGGNMYSTIRDMNADGLPDRIGHYNNGDYGIWVALNTGTKFDYANATKWLDNNTFNSGYDYLPERGGGGGNMYSVMIDMNADSLPDRVVHYNNGDYGIWVALNTGSGFDFTNATKWLDNNTFNSGYDYLPIRGAGLGQLYSMILDMNGDGLPDRVVHYNNGDYGVWVALNTGSEFDFANATKWVTQGTFGSGFDYIPLRSDGNIYSDLRDMNGDGLPDRVVHYNNSTYGVWVALNKGDGFMTAELWLPNGVFGSGYDYLPIRGSSGTTIYSDLRDVNGDGRPDRVVHYNSPTHGIWVALNKQKIPDIVKTIKNGRGAQIDVTYKPATQVDGAIVGETSSYPNAVVNKAPRLLVSEFTVDGGIDDPATTRYEYNDGKMKLGFRWEIENLGFDTIKKIDDTTGSYVINDYRQDLPFHGMVDKVRSFDVNDNPFNVVENYFGSRVDNPSFPQIKFLYKTQLDTYDYNGGLSFIKKMRVHYDTYNNYGFLTKKRDLGDISVVTDDIEINTEFAVDTNLYVMVPSRTYSYGYKLDGTTWALSGETRLYYDNLTTLSSVDEGLLTKRETKKNSTDYIVETFGYDVFGNETWYKDGRINANEDYSAYTNFTGYTSQTTYDTFCAAYVVTQTNALGHTVTNHFDENNLFRIEKITDANGVDTLFEHDVFGNVIKTIRPGDSSTYPSQESIFNYTDSTAPTCVIAKAKKDENNNYIETYTYYDGLGRVIQAKTQADVTNQWITGDTYYNHVGK